MRRDNLGCVEKITSYSGSGGTGTLRNQIQFTYDDFWRVSKSRQNKSCRKSRCRLSIPRGANDTLTIGAVVNETTLTEVVFDFQDYARSCQLSILLTSPT